MKYLMMLILALVVAAGCSDEKQPTKPGTPDQEKEGLGERAGRKVDQAAEKTGEALQYAGEKTKEGAKAAARKTGEALQWAGKKLEGVGTDSDEKPAEGETPQTPEEPSVSPEQPNDQPPAQPAPEPPPTR